jgi:sugar lactone lactonase YvrE/uncharacterized protein (DUF2345 family)
MHSTGFQRCLILALCGVALATLFPYHSSAQVTYNDFNIPQANSGQTSATCASGSAAPGVLFCFNFVGNGLSFIQDNSYTTSIDPNETNGSAFALQLTQNAGSQSSSMWYSIPQNVAGGFTAWYAFKITPGSSPYGDGLAFVIQNALGGGAISSFGASCAETGSGLTTLGGGGGCIGYGAIDNSIALEADTFADSYDPWDFGNGDYDDNHIAMQDCGAGLANSPAHYTSNSVSPLVPISCLVPLGGGTYAIASDPSSSAGTGGVNIADGYPHQIVVVYNGPNDSPANYIYVYIDPAFNPGTHTPVEGSTPIFSGPFNIAQSINLNNGTAYVGFTAATGGSYQQNELMGFSFTPHNSASANVCPSGQTTPAPCSSTLPVTFNVAANTTIGSIKVVTQGAPNLDFQLDSGSTCTGTFSTAGSCTVNVNFAPLAPGLRMGAVELLDGSNTVLATKLIYGVGYGPVTAFGPGTQTPIYTGSSSFYAAGAAVDAAGDLFIAENQGTENNNGLVVKVAPDSTQSTVGSGLAYPQGLALDGAGDVYIADNNLNEVVEVTPAGVQTTVGTGLAAQLGVAVDGPGDVFIGDFTGDQVVEVPANGGPQTVVYSSGSGFHPVGLAVDAAGDLFISDYADTPPGKVVEIPAGCSTNSCQTTVGSGWYEPEAVAVDAAGDVLVADEAPKVVEVPAGCTNINCQISISGTLAYGVALDGNGDVFIPDLNGHQVDEINKSQPPSLTFASTNVGYTSSDSPQSVTIQNIGNQTLSAISPGLVVNGPNFIQAPGASALADCSATFSLSLGASCNLSISFKPQSAGNPFTSTAVFTDNNLNAISTSPAATQTIGLSGVGVSSTYTIGGSVTGLVGSGLVLQDNSGDNLSISGNGPFTFLTFLNNGSPYSVTVFSSPLAQNCAVTEGGGTVANANITNVLVTCTTIPSYGLSVTEVGSGSGTVTSSPGAISCIESNGSVTGTCSDSYLSGTPVTLTASATGTSTFLGWGGACAASGTSPTCNVAVSSVLNATASFVQQSFGNVNVCPSGQSTPVPCSGTLTLTYNLAATTTIGVTQVVTEGITGLDFSLGTGGTCTGMIAEGASCTVNVNFAPLAPGLRMGAVSLFDSGGNPVATAPIYGIGLAPAIAFGPGVQTTEPASGLNHPVGVALDGAGDLFIASYGNGTPGAGSLVKVTPGGVQTTVPTSGLIGPINVAVDGAGDLFIVDYYGGQAVKVTPAGVQTTVASGLSNPVGIALDGAGDVFIGDGGHNRVVKVTPGGVQTTVPVSGLNQPWGVAADAAGDVFIADGGSNNRVVEVTPGGVQTVVPAMGLKQPYDVAVDAAGDVFIADPQNSRVVQVSPTGVQTTVPATGLNYPSGVAVDATGDVFIGDQGSGAAFEINHALPPSLSFPLTNQYSTSSPQSVSIQNVGNELLSGSLALTLGANFTAGGSSTCGSGFNLVAGASCSESFDFTPQTTGYLTGTAGFSDNTFNLSQAVSLQTVNLAGNGGLNGMPVGIVVPNVVGLSQAAATTALTNAGLTLGTVSNAGSSLVPQGNVSEENPAAGSQVNVGSAVRLLVSSGQPQPVVPNPLSLLNNYFVTGDYATGGITLRGQGSLTTGIATGTITIPAGNVSPGVPTGSDIIDGYLYWEVLENTALPSGGNGTFLGDPITGQQIGADQPFTDGGFTGTLRVYRADVNAYFPAATDGSGIRYGSGSFTVTLPDSGGSKLPLCEGASMVVIYRVLVAPGSTTPAPYPLKSIVIYDGSAIPTSSTTQNMQGFYDAVGGGSGTGEATTFYYAPGPLNTAGTWDNSSSSVTLGQPNQYSAPLSQGNVYAAVILSTAVNNTDNDGILDAWKDGAPSGDFHAGQPGYYDVKTGSWVPLPGAAHHQKDLFVQLDYMCGNVLSTGACDPTQENLFPAPDADGNDPLAMVTQAYAANGVALHLEVGNAVAESTCNDSSGQLCEFPSQPGVIGWKNSLEFSKLWPRNYDSCVAGGDCSPRFPYGQKDSYHYVLFGHSLAIPAWNARYGTLTGIAVSGSTTTITTTGLGPGTNPCPSRITISGVIGNPNLNGVYNTTSCSGTAMVIATPAGAINPWNYPNSTPELDIGITSGTVTSISGYSDLGGQDSAVTLGLWETSGQDMSKRANVIAGTLFHEIGHTLGLSHGGLYYDSLPSLVPTFEGNCKPNYQSSMNYLFQLDGVGPNNVIAYSNQQLETLSESSLGSVYDLDDVSSNPATYSTSAWYVSSPPSPTASQATLHCDGTPVGTDIGYRVDGAVDPVSPANPLWTNDQDITFDQQTYSSLRGYNDWANIDLRQVGATGGEYASLATVLSFGSTLSPLNVAAGGTVALGAGGTVALGAGGTVTLGAGGNATLSSASTITAGSVTLNNGGSAILSTGATVTLGAGGNLTYSGSGFVTFGTSGTVTYPGGGTVTLGAGGNVTLGAGGTITFGTTQVTIPSTGGSYNIPSDGTVTLGPGGNVTLGAGGTVALGAGGTIALGAGGNVTLSAGGNVTLGAGGTVALGAGGTVALGAGGNVTLGAGGTVALGAGGNVTLGAGGNVTLGAGGTVTLGAGGNVTLGAGGNVTLGAGGTVTLGAGGNVTLGAGGTVTLGAGGTVTLGAGGMITSSGTTTSVGAGTYTVSAGGTVALGAGGNVTLGAGGTVTLGAGGNVTLGAGGTVTLGAGGTVALGAGGNVTLGAGGTVALGAGGASTAELDYNTANSVVRPPVSPGETPMQGAVIVTWNAPAFGVVQTYTIYRSSDGATPIEIGSVSGLNGNPPATTFTDTNPDTTSATVVYTITTTLVPDTPGSTPRSSQPSPPAVMKNYQTISLSLPGSVSISNSPATVSATALTNGSANGLEVNFVASGSCSIGSQSISGGVSSASVTLNSTGQCNITASQSGSSTYDAATPVSGSFTIQSQSSNTQQQTISFAPLPNVQYANTFSFSAFSSSGLAVSFSVPATGPCTITSSVTTGVTTAATGFAKAAGLCTITASVAGNSTYSSASVVQSFTIYPAVLTVTAISPPGVAYGQPLPALTYQFGPFVNGDTSAVVNGVPALSTTATTTSSPGGYPITVTTGSLAAANYSFLYVSGTLTLQSATPTISINNVPSAVYGGSFTPTYAYSGNGTPTESTASSTPTVCSVSSGLVSFVGVGTCTLTPSATATTDYSAVTGSPQNITVGTATPTISINNVPSAVYGGSFTPTYVYSGNGIPTESVASSTTTVCTVSAGKVSFVGVGTCTLTPSATATTDYSAVTGSPQNITVNQASQSITFTQASPVTYGVAPITLSATATSGQAVTFKVDASSTAAGTVVGNILTVKGAGNLVIDANQAGNSDYLAATQVQRTIVVSKALLTVTANNASRAYGLANPSFNASYGGFVLGDSFATAVTGSPSLTTTAVATSLPGSYPIVASQGTLAAANYTFSFANGTLTVTFTGSVPASGTACNGAYSGTFSGNLTVSGTETCIFVGGGASGNITETGGNVLLSGATIGGSVTVSGGTFSIGPSTTIKGSLQVQSIPKGSATNQVCGTTIDGSLQFLSNGTAVLIGSGTSSCAGNVIKSSLQVISNSAAVTIDGNTVSGSLQVESNSAAVTMDNNKVTGSLQVLSNTGATTLDGNTVGGSLQDESNPGATQVISNVITAALQCSSNTTITGSGNTAASKTGQCAKF